MMLLCYSIFILCVCFVDRCLSFFFWPLCYMSFDSDYPFGIFKHFLQYSRERFMDVTERDIKTGTHKLSKNIRFILFLTPCLLWSGLCNNSCSCSRWCCVCGGSKVTSPPTYDNNDHNDDSYKYNSSNNSSYRTSRIIICNIR